MWHPRRTNDNRHLNLRSQRGAAFIVMLVILVMGVATIMVRSLSSSGIKIERDVKTAEALAQAKEALIGYAASDDTRPGELPCPDIDGDGKLTMGTDYSFGSPPLCSSFVGYLPWFTLGLPELRDGNNEKLWYALSNDFYAGNSAVLNSDTQGQLSITGNVTMSNVAAIVFAPGAPLCGKTHNSNNVTDYLEAGDGTTTSYALKSFSDDCNSPYNDNLVAITASHIFPTVEKIVGDEIKQMLNIYYAAWGAYPFAAPFSDPSTSSFVGSAGTFNGLLPRASTATPANLAAFPVWRSASLTSSATGGTVSGIFVMKTGTKMDSSWRYESMVITGTPTITITGILDNVGFGLWPPYDPATTQISVRVGGTYYAASTKMTNVSVKGVLQPDGSALVTFKGTVQAGNIPDRIRFKDLRPCVFQSTYCPSTSTTWKSWFGANNWDHVTYYATSSGFAPSGTNTCNPLPGTPYCLTVNGNGGGNDKRAAIIMTGRALAGQVHPQNTIAHYLEGVNTSPSSGIYETKTLSDIFNDQVIPVAP